MDEKQQYTQLIGEIIKKQSVILGPEIAILKARGVHGLVIDDEGNVSDIGSEPAETLQSLVDQYVELSGQIVKNALGSIFARYPDININR